MGLYVIRIHTQHNDFVPSAVFIYVAVSLDSNWLSVSYEGTKLQEMDVGEPFSYLKTSVDCGSWKCVLAQCSHY
jgi:hypothetical protein